MEEVGLVTYLLLINLAEKSTLRVGKLGLITFWPGYYVYSGSALKNFIARISRHLKKEKRYHWHIDYFLEKGQILEIRTVDSKERLECVINQQIQTNVSPTNLIPRFGSSDCRCFSHLAYFKKKPDLSNIGKNVKIEALTQP